MATQYSTAVRNASNDAIETTIGPSPTLELRSGAQPATCATADSGTLLASMTLPSNWMADSASGVKALLGTCEDLIADATGNAGHYRIKQGGTCHQQGSASQRAADGGTGDLQLDQATAGIVAGQKVTIAGFTSTMGGA